MIISRAGANAIHEFLALKKPMLLIPLPLSASRGDQRLNAKSFKERGIAKVLEEENVTNETLMAAVNELEADSAKMIYTMSEHCITVGTQKVLSVIKECCK